MRQGNSRDKDRFDKKDKTLTKPEIVQRREVKYRDNELSNINEDRLMKVMFLKCIWEIRTSNPSLAVEILNVNPRPILPSQKAWLEMASDNHLEFEQPSSPRIF